MTWHAQLTADDIDAIERFFEGAPPEQTVTLTELRAAMRDVLPTEAILVCWRPGSGDWDWSTEWADIVQQQAGMTIAALIGDIAAHGVREPLLLGDDGRVWDGHHRLFVARLLGIETLPVEYGHSGPQEVV